MCGFSGYEQHIGLILLFDQSKIKETAEKIIKQRKAI